MEKALPEIDLPVWRLYNWFAIIQQVCAVRASQCYPSVRSVDVLKAHNPSKGLAFSAEHVRRAGSHQSQSVRLNGRLHNNSDEDYMHRIRWL